MTHEEALAALRAETPHERLKAARFLARHAQAADIKELRRARRHESVSYVKTALDRAIDRLSNLPSPNVPDPSDEIEVPEDVKRQNRAQAIEWVAGLLLHEIASPIGLVKRTASREIEDYDASRTKRHLENLERIFEAIEQLKGATAVPRPEQFDLAELIAEAANELGAETLAKTSLVGPKPMIVTSDPALVRLAVANGLRNARDAVRESGAGDSHLVVVTWGQTDVDYWVSILDRGPGILGPVEAAFEIGKTTKQGHSGFGLAIARQAIETLGGTVTLEPAAQGGARYEARWER